LILNFQTVISLDYAVTARWFQPLEAQARFILYTYWFEVIILFIEKFAHTATFIGAQDHFAKQRGNRECG